MKLFSDMLKTAREAREHSRKFRERFSKAQDRFTKPPEPPTITLDSLGTPHVEPQPGALVVLGRSLLVLVFSAAAMSLSWLTTALLALYLLAQRLFGLQIHLASWR